MITATDLSDTERHHRADTMDQIAIAFHELASSLRDGNDERAAFYIALIRMAGRAVGELSDALHGIVSASDTALER